MKQRKLGKSSLPCSEIGLGCWQLGGDFGGMDEQRANAILDEAIKHGLTFWDTADVYGAGISERYIGQYLSNNPDSKDVVVATKLGRSPDLYPNQYSHDGVRMHIEQSLERLQTDCLDLIQLHCIPPSYLERGEIFSWLEDFQSEGLIKAYGASVETMEEALTCMKYTGLTSLQMIVNLFRQEPVKKVFDQALQSNVGIIVRLPLASGLLSGKYNSDTTFEKQDHRNYNRNGECFHVGETFSGLSFETGLKLVEELKLLLPESLSMATSSLRWLLDHNAVSTVIAGVSKPEQVKVNAMASNTDRLDEEIHDKLFHFYEDSVKVHVRGAL